MLKIILLKSDVQMLSRDDDSSSNGIFVLNGQIFSVNDLINAMRRQGINIRLNREGISIDNEYIPSITNLEGDRCPLAKICEKRIALVEFLKLQKSRQALHEYGDERRSPTYQQSFTRNFTPEESPSRESSSPDFIRPNNHDLFEGNVSDSRALFDEPLQSPSRGLFDEPDFTSGDTDLPFEDSLFERNNNFDSSFSRDKERFSERFSDDSHHTNNSSQLFCKKCGYDLQSNWKVCPSCGYRIERQESQRSEDYLF